MIKNIVFDMGNVLIRFDRELFMDALGIMGEDRRLITREVFRSVDWAKLDRGAHSEAQAAEIMCTRLPSRLHEAVHMLVEHWFEPIIPIEGMEELVRRLREKGYRLYLLSNAGYAQHDYWSSIPGSEYFDGKVISADCHIIKPQPEIYHALCDRYALEPSECVFIDDGISNCEAAVFCGMEAIVFNGDVNELREKLKALNVDL